MSDPTPTLDLHRSHGSFTEYPREAVFPEGSIVLVTCSVSISCRRPATTIDATGTVPERCVAAGCVAST